MQNLLFSNIKHSIRFANNIPAIPFYKQVNFISSTSKLFSNQHTNFNEIQGNKKLSLFSHHDKFKINTASIMKSNILYRSFSNTSTKYDQESSDKKQLSEKKPSKFKQFYSQYGPLFVVVHLITVVMWIYGFFLISKQGYDITQLLNLFEKINIMSEETVKNIHYKIDNYKTESTWITGTNIKHFATAYMVYKVIAPFRYMVSLALVRSLIQALRSKGLMK